MARFYMSVKGNKSNSTTVHRLSQNGGGTTCASYSGAITCTPYHKDGVDMVRVMREPWKGSNGPRVVIYDGPFDISAGYATDLV